MTRSGGWVTVEIEDGASLIFLGSVTS